jgi:hypothetical protein
VQFELDALDSARTLAAAVDKILDAHLGERGGLAAMRTMSPTGLTSAAS